MWLFCSAHIPFANFPLRIYFAEITMFTEGSGAIGMQGKEEKIRRKY